MQAQWQYAAIKVKTNLQGATRAFGGPLETATLTDHRITTLPFAEALSLTFFP